MSAEDWRARVESWLNIRIPAETSIFRVDDNDANSIASSESLPAVEVLLSRARSGSENVSALNNNDTVEMAQSTVSSEDLPSVEELLAEMRRRHANNHDSTTDEPMDDGSLPLTEINYPVLASYPGLRPLSPDMVIPLRPEASPPISDEVETLSIGSSCDDMEQDLCPICFGRFHEKTTTGCGHSFHTACLQRWRLEHDTCPYCRTSFKKK